MRAEPTPADATLFDDFQRELEALDTFREQYRHLYPFAGLDRDDPDVLRLLEGLAFFTARTRREADRALAGYERRALEELFPYLVSPMPCMALLSVEGTERLAEARTLPAATEIAVTARGEGAPVLFRTLRPLRLSPIDLDRQRIELVDVGDGWQLTVPIRSASPRVERLDVVELHLDPHGDLLAALRLHHALRHHVEEVWCEFPGTRQRPRRCRQVWFGPPVPAADGDEVANPLEPLRRLLHFPLAALVVRVGIDETPATWDRLELRFRIAASWPRELAVPPGALLLHATPMINLRRGLAEPAPLDGTRARVQVAHPEPGLGLQPRELLGVFRSTAAGLAPILPETLAGDGEDWHAVEVVGRQTARQVWLDVHAPTAFDAAATAVVDAEWYQPGAGRRLGASPTVAPVSRYLEGPRWRVVAPVQDSVDSPLAGRRERLRRLLAISGGALDAAALTFLLDTLGTASHDLLARVTRAIATVEVDSGPDARAVSGRRTTYRIGLARLPRVLRPAAELVFAQVPGMLAAWSGIEAPEVRLHVTDDEDDVEIVFRMEGGTP